MFGFDFGTISIDWEANGFFVLFFVTFSVVVQSKVASQIRWSVLSHRSFVRLNRLDVTGCLSHLTTRRRIHPNASIGHTRASEQR